MNINIQKKGYALAHPFLLSKKNTIYSTIILVVKTSLPIINLAR